MHGGSSVAKMYARRLLIRHHVDTIQPAKSTPSLDTRASRPIQTPIVLLDDPCSLEYVFAWKNVFESYHIFSLCRAHLPCTPVLGHWPSGTSTPAKCCIRRRAGRRRCERPCCRRFPFSQAEAWSLRMPTAISVLPACQAWCSQSSAADWDHGQRPAHLTMGTSKVSLTRHVRFVQKRPWRSARLVAPDSCGPISIRSVAWLSPTHKWHQTLPAAVRGVLLRKVVYLSLGLGWHRGHQLPKQVLSVSSWTRHCDQS